ncbi:MAG TPA: FkbM family methyltransferase [Hanamia sp.]
MMEIIRRTVRSIIKSDTRFYNAVANFLNFLFTTSEEGIGCWRKLKALGEGKRQNGPPQPITLRKLNYPIWIRPGTQDAGTLINNVIREEYGHFMPSTDPEWMIDAGAYIGDTSAYFLSRFPLLKVIALEPNPLSYELANVNLIPYGERVILLQKGLYSNEQELCFSGEETGASIAEIGIKISCTTILSLLKQYSIPRLDILKMDIEGAEEAIFLAHPKNWLDRINLLILEIHAPHIKSLVSEVLNKNGFSMKQYRSLWYCRRII